MAAYTSCLSSDQVRELTATPPSSRVSRKPTDCTLGDLEVLKALKLLPDDPIVLAKYAQNLCNYLNFDVADERGQEEQAR